MYKCEDVAPEEEIGGILYIAASDVPTPEPANEWVQVEERDGVVYVLVEQGDTWETALNMLRQFVSQGQLVGRGIVELSAPFGEKQFYCLMRWDEMGARPLAGEGIDLIKLLELNPAKLSNIF